MGKEGNSGIGSVINPYGNGGNMGFGQGFF